MDSILEFIIEFVIENEKKLSGCENSTSKKNIMIGFLYWKQSALITCNSKYPKMVKWVH